MYAAPCTIFTEKVYNGDREFAVPAIQPIAFNPEATHLSWERLEALRLQRLGIPNRYSRHCNIVYNNQIKTQMEKNGCTGNLLRMDKPRTTSNNNKTKNNANNSLAPFYTHEKPTCGFFFSRETDNRKLKFGIDPSDLVAWRSSNPVQ